MFTQKPTFQKWSRNVRIISLYTIWKIIWGIISIDFNMEEHNYWFQYGLHERYEHTSIRY